jgi:hypothetical protein
VESTSLQFRRWSRLKFCAQLEENLQNLEKRTRSLSPRETTDKGVECVVLQCSSYRIFSRPSHGAPASNGISTESSRTCRLRRSAKATSSDVQQTGQPRARTAATRATAPDTTEATEVTRLHPATCANTGRSVSSIRCRRSVVVRLPARRGRSLLLGRRFPICAQATHV